MRSFLPIIIAGLTLALGTGCSSVGISDNLPSDSTKGYVVFYCWVQPIVKEIRWQQPIVRELIDGKWKSLGRLKSLDKGFWTDTSRPHKHSLRVATKPGLHSFKVSIGPWSEQIEIETRDGMVTPVEAYFAVYNAGARYSGTTLTIEVRARLIREDAIPIGCNADLKLMKDTPP